MLEAESTTKSSIIGALINAENSTKRWLGNGCNDALSNGLMKYKRRKIAVIRDYPPGCGRDLDKINGKATDDVVVVGANNVKARTDNATTVEAVVTGKSETLENLVQTVLAEKSVSLDQPTKSVEVVAVVLPKTLGQTESIDLPKPLGLRVNESSESDLRLAGSQLGEKTSTRNYPPRKKILATRDFPHGCERNSAPVVKEYCLKAVASFANGSLCDRLSGAENRQSEKIVRADVKEIRYEDLDGSNLEEKLEQHVLIEVEDELQVKYDADIHKENSDGVLFGTSPEGNSNQEDEKVQSGIYSKSRLKEENTKKFSDKHPHESSLSRPDSKLCINFEKLLESKEVKMEKGSTKHCKDKGVKRGFPCESESEIGSSDKFQNEDSIGLGSLDGREVVLALMAAPFCPWRQGKRAFKSNLSTRTERKFGNGHENIGQDIPKSISMKKKDEAETYERNTTLQGNADIGTNQMVLKNGEDLLKHDDNYKNVHLVQRSREFDVSLIPFGLSTVHSIDEDSKAVVTRKAVRETLRLFQVIYRKLLQEEETKSKERGYTLRIDLQASKLLKEKQKWVNTGKQIFGSVPGVEIGDEFHFRAELAIIGLHHQFQGGIDYLKKDGKILATSIVATSGRYADDMDSSDVLTYSGQGGNPVNGDKNVEDQKLERGNLALKNSMDAQIPVRVIRGFKEQKLSDSTNARSKVVATYIYDGLYLVDEYWQEMGQYGKLIFKFQLRRIPGQPELALKEITKSKKFKVREGLCLDDISQGKEKNKICAINTLDDEKPPLFEYTTDIMYPDWYKPITPNGCDCTDGCSDSEKCACAVKNGGEIPFNYDGAIVEAKPLVYECGPACKCPPSCHNRVSQHGVKFQLEIFKTESRGWGVRSLTSILSGSFICEYTGELLEDKEADQRTGNDEYLFDIGPNYSDNSLLDGFSTLIHDLQPCSSCEVMEDAGFTIDAAHYGNVGRFINHSCSPNLYAQNVLYDHDDKRIPHIMLFAAENIPPLQELTYHYNYMIDQVRDSNGNIKQKNCYCGSFECSGRMY